MINQPVIIDCDPGVDDAVALFLAFGAPEIDILGITAVAGNIPLSSTESNARRLCELGGRPEVKVLAGCGRPLLYPQRKGVTVHGQDGLGDIGIAPPTKQLHPGHAANFIIDQINAAPGKVTIAALGPMTNLAVALAMDPSIAQKIGNLVFMGGAAFCPGNITPQAEFNFFFDPHAAQAVLASGIPMVMFGLDVTRSVIITAERIERLAATGEIGAVSAKLLSAYSVGDPLLHDPCVIAYLIDPTLFTGIEAFVEVECQSELSIGQTVASVSARSLAGRQPNCTVITGVDDVKLFDLLEERIGALRA